MRHPSRTLATALVLSLAACRAPRGPAGARAGGRAPGEPGGRRHPWHGQRRHGPGAARRPGHRARGGERRRHDRPERQVHSTGAPAGALPAARPPERLLRLRSRDGRAAAQRPARPDDSAPPGGGRSGRGHVAADGDDGRLRRRSPSSRRRRPRRATRRRAATIRTRPWRGSCGTSSAACCATSTASPSTTARRTTRCSPAPRRRAPGSAGRSPRRRAWPAPCSRTSPSRGEINLLTTSTFDGPQDLFSSGNRLPRGVAFLSLGAPAGQGDWSMKAALTGGDVSSWILAGSYSVHGPRTHAYDVGLSYGTQAYKGGSTAALAAIADGNRNVGAVYAFDDWKVSRHVELDYGARWARYGYVDRPNMFSPRVALSVSPFDRTFVRAAVSQRMLAPRRRGVPAADLRRLAAARAHLHGHRLGRLPRRARAVVRGGARAPARRFVRPGRPPLLPAVRRPDGDALRAGAGARRRRRPRALLRRIGGRRRCRRVGRQPEQLGIAPPQGLDRLQPDPRALDAVIRRRPTSTRSCRRPFGSSRRTSRTSRPRSKPPFPRRPRGCTWSTS